MPALDPANTRAQGLGFDAAKLRLALPIEDLSDGNALLGFDFLVKIDEVPAQPFGEHPADGSLARGHEAGQVNSRRLFEFQDHAETWL